MYIYSCYTRKLLTFLQSVHLVAFSTTKSTSSLLKFGFFNLFAYIFKNQFNLINSNFKNQLYNKLQKPSFCDETQIDFDLLTHFISCFPSFPSFYFFSQFCIVPNFSSSHTTRFNLSSLGVFPLIFTVYF